MCVLQELARSPFICKAFCFWVPGTGISCYGAGLFVHVLSWAVFWAVFRLFCY